MLVLQTLCRCSNRAGFRGPLSLAGFALRDCASCLHFSSGCTAYVSVFLRVWRAAAHCQENRLSSWFSELPVFLHLVHWQASETYVRTCWVVRRSLWGPLRRQLSRRSRPREHESLEMGLQERMCSHVWETLRPSFSSWIFQGPLGCQKYQEVLQGRHMLLLLFF